MFNLSICRNTKPLQLDEVRSVFDEMFDGEFVVDVANVQVKERGVIAYNTKVVMKMSFPLTEEADDFYDGLDRWGVIQVNLPGDAGHWNVVLEKCPRKLKPLYVNRVSNTTTEWDMFAGFNRVFQGDFVEKVDMKKKRDSRGVPYFSVFVHLRQDRYPKEQAEPFYAKLEKGNVEVKTDSGVWKVALYTEQMRPDELMEYRRWRSMMERVMTADEKKEFKTWQENKNKPKPKPIHPIKLVLEEGEIDE
jgi:hypothetical protein